MFSKDNIKTQMMSEEELKDPTLIKKASEENPIICYFGSKKEGIENACLKCKKRLRCNHFFELEIQKMEMRKLLKNEDYLHNNFTDKEIEKIKTNILVIADCVYMEE